MTRSLTELKAKHKKYRFLGSLALIVGGFILFLGSSLNHKECFGACSTQDWFDAGGNPNAIWYTVQDGGFGLAVGWILIALGIWAVTLAAHFNSLIKSSSSIIEGLGGQVEGASLPERDREVMFCPHCGAKRIGAFCTSCGSPFSQ